MPQIHNVNAYFPRTGILGNVTININMVDVAIVIANLKLNLKSAFDEISSLNTWNENRSARMPQRGLLSPLNTDDIDDVKAK